MKRVGNELKQTTWDDALHIAAEKLKGAGPDAGFISTAGILNEDALVLKQLAAAVKTKNVDTTVSLYADADSLINESAEPEAADLIILVGLNPSQWKRVLPGARCACKEKGEFRRKADCYKFRRYKYLICGNTQC